LSIFGAMVRRSLCAAITTDTVGSHRRRATGRPASRDHATSSSG
jgi:hypothetical protein